MIASTLSETPCKITYMELSKRIAEIRAETGLNQSEFGRALGVKSQAVSQWESGKTKSIKPVILEKIHRLYGYNPWWVSNGRLPKKIPRGRVVGVADSATGYDDEGRSGITIRSISVRASHDSALGFEVQHTEDDDQGVAYYRKDWLEKKGWREEALSIRPVSGSSMEPALYDGDQVLINEDLRTPRHGMVFAVASDGHLEIKRLQKRGSEWWITADNPAYSRFDQRLESLEHIIGQAVDKNSSVI